MSHHYRATPATPTALVIEDNEVYRDRLRTMLKELGWTAEVAANGYAGWEMAQRSDFDVVFCGVILPQQDGFETIHLLREHLPDAHIVALSGSGTLHSGLYLKMARWFGADAALTTPFGVYDLLKATRGMFRARAA